MTLDNTGGIALVTGAGSGIGRATAITLARRGTPVVVLDIDPGAAADTCTRILEGGGQASIVVADVAHDPAVADAVARIAAEFGPPTIVVNAAGTACRSGLLDTSLDDWNRVLAVNLTGYFSVLRHVVPRMRDAGGGAVVQVASVTGHIGYGYPAYTAAKGAILAMTRQLAQELAPWRIRVNSVSPGVIRTGLNQTRLAVENVLDTKLRQIPLRRLGEPDDVAAAVEFLTSRRAGFVTGVDLVVDGGMISGIHWH